MAEHARYRECRNCIFMEQAPPGEKRPICRHNPPRAFGYALTRPEWWCGQWQRHPAFASVGALPNIGIPEGGTRWRVFDEPEETTPAQIGAQINAAKSAYRAMLDAESLAATKQDIAAQTAETHRRVVRRVWKGAVQAAENGNVPALQWLQDMAFFSKSFGDDADDIDVFRDWDGE